MDTAYLDLDDRKIAEKQADRPTKIDKGVRPIKYAYRH
jgi:hypothetical protein